MQPATRQPPPTAPSLDDAGGSRIGPALDFELDLPSTADAGTRVVHNDARRSKESTTSPQQQQQPRPPPGPRPLDMSRRAKLGLPEFNHSPRAGPKECQEMLASILGDDYTPRYGYLAAIRHASSVATVAFSLRDGTSARPGTRASRSPRRLDPVFPSPPGAAVSAHASDDDPPNTPAMFTDSRLPADEPWARVHARATMHANLTRAGRVNRRNFVQFKATRIQQGPSANAAAPEEDEAWESELRVSELGKSREEVPLIAAAADRFNKLHRVRGRTADALLTGLSLDITSPRLASNFEVAAQVCTDSCCALVYADSPEATL